MSVSYKALRMLCKEALEQYILNPDLENWKRCLEEGFEGNSDDYEEWKLYPFVLERLKDTSKYTGIVKNLEERCVRIESFNERSIPHYSEALMLLNKAEIPYVLIKGAALIACGLSVASKRVLSDVDVLISYRDLEKACEVLNRSEYWNLDPEYEGVNPHVEREMHFTNGECAIFDLHWQPFSLFFSEDLTESMLRSRTECLLWDIPVYIPAHEYLFFNVVIHGFHSRQGIVWILDAQMMLDELAIDWDKVCALVSHYQLNQVMMAADTAAKDLLPKERLDRLRGTPFGMVELLEYLSGDDVPYRIDKRFFCSLARSIRLSSDTRAWYLPLTYLRHLYHFWGCRSSCDFFVALFMKLFRFKASIERLED